LASNLKQNYEIIEDSKGMPRNPCFLPSAHARALVDHVPETATDFVSTVYNAEDYTELPTITDVDVHGPSEEQLDCYSEDFTILLKEAQPTKLLVISNNDNT
jgi:hypothetical protein